jgi:putative transposase
MTGFPAGIGRIKRLRKKLGCALMKALDTKRPTPGLFITPIVAPGIARMPIKPTRSRRGNCYDNAPMESFWRTLKNEFVYHRRYETRD